MMRRWLLVSVLLALALPAAAGSTATRTIRLNDEFAVEKSHILCAVENSKTFIPGQKLIVCFLVANPKIGPAPKTYAVALAVNGEVALGRVTKGGGIQVVTTRTPSSPSSTPTATGSRKGALYKVAVGTAILVKGTAITCAVSRQKFAGKSVITVACFKVSSSKKPRPSSYGIGMTDGGAFLVHFDAKSKGAPIKVVQHGK